MVQLSLRGQATPKSKCLIPNQDDCLCRDTQTSHLSLVHFQIENGQQVVVHYPGSSDAMLPASAIPTAVVDQDPITDDPTVVTVDTVDSGRRHGNASIQCI